MEEAGAPELRVAEVVPVYPGNPVHLLHKTPHLLLKVWVERVEPEVRVAQQLLEEQAEPVESEAAAEFPL